MNIKNTHTLIAYAALMIALIVIIIFQAYTAHENKKAYNSIIRNLVISDFVFAKENSVIYPMTKTRRINQCFLWVFFIFLFVLADF
jgi:hypothetical protein